MLGILRASRPRTNPFLIEGLHTNVALLAMGFGGLHVIASILDPFARLGPTDALVPFVSAYRGTWLGLGVISAYVYVAGVLTSWPFRRLPRPVWKWVHRTLYAAWALALVHSLGTGSDARNGLFLALDFLAAGSVLIAFVAVRVADAWPASPALPAAITTIAIALALGLAVWVYTGPFQPGWARASGTPPDLLRSP